MANVVKHFLKLLPLTLIVSVGNDVPVTAFLNPCGLNAGGATGVTTVLSHWTSVPFAVVYSIINLPILFFGLRHLNIRFSVYSVFVTLVTTLLFPYLAPFTIHVKPVLAAVVGGVIYGFSIGVTYRYDFSLGGFALLAKVLEVVTRKQVGAIFTVINFVPVILAFGVNHSKQALLRSIVFISVTGIAIDFIALGMSYLTHCKTQLQKFVRLPSKIYDATKQINKAT